MSDPKARKSFAARHKCAQQTDKTKAAYWACRLPRYAKQLGLSGGGNFSGRPYQEYDLLNGDKVSRAFDDQSNPLEFIWHRDQEDREVYVEEEGSGWMFQYDNELPVELTRAISYLYRNDLP